MTEKRFAVTQTVLGSGIYDFQAEDTLCESYDEDAYGEVCKKLNELAEENKELQERNNRQYKQLDDLYRLIEEKDWRALSDIMDDFQKAEEQLQKEWRTYGDIE